MILKLKEGNKESYAWHFIDRVTGIHIIEGNTSYKDDGKTLKMIDFSLEKLDGTVENLHQNLFNEAYLLNDEGKTIQTIVSCIEASENKKNK